MTIADTTLFSFLHWHRSRRNGMWNLLSVACFINEKYKVQRLAQTIFGAQSLAEQTTLDYIQCIPRQCHQCCQIQQYRINRSYGRRRKRADVELGRILLSMVRDTCHIADCGVHCIRYKLAPNYHKTNFAGDENVFICELQIQKW